MQSTRGIILLLLSLIHPLIVFAQIDCQASCSPINALLAPCNVIFTLPNPGEIVNIQFGATEAKCYCNKETYNQLVTCSNCINNSGENKNLKVEDLDRYKNVCATFAVAFTDNPTNSQGPTQPTSPTDNPADEPQINNDIPDSIDLNSKSSYIILGIVVGIPVLIILIIFIYKCCFKRRKSIKIKRVTSQTFLDKTSQIDLTDNSSITSIAPSQLQAFRQQQQQQLSQISIERDDLTEISIDDYEDITSNNDIQQQHHHHNYNFKRNY
ncbi:hypothetical protein C1645_822089 [Glomus cerebriforme]|uniref:Mid2 domain-containing protein n=1 Tax=Glomus cerebriforme TaxID=658196 RepID=A0A397T8T9_9GLOM|nr:hypothetical protein C1645_822089 [Glomus cerebriforme]